MAEPKKPIKINLLESHVNFKELITLQPLATQIEVFNVLKKNLDNYQWKFFKSFLMTGPKLLEYIPYEQHEDYFNVIITDKYNSHNNNIRNYSNKKTKTEIHQELIKSGYSTLSDWYKESDETYYIVDTKRKQIIPVILNPSRGHQGYGREEIYSKKGSILTVELKFSYVPWYANTSPRKYFSHYYKFNLLTNTFKEAIIKEIQR